MVRGLRLISYNVTKYLGIEAYNNLEAIKAGVRLDGFFSLDVVKKSIHKNARMQKFDSGEFEGLPLVVKKAAHTVQVPKVQI